MLSNPNSNLHPRQHRRQNSTPTAFEAAKVPLLHQFQRQSSHRRGMSLDQRPQQRQIYPQETVSSTNPGFQHIQQQHILREAQQQRLARPGHRTPQHSDFGEEESYLISPLGTPARSSFDTGYSNLGDSSPISSSYDFYTGPVNQIIRVNPPNNIGIGGSNDLPYNDNSILSPSTYLQSFSFDDVPNQQSSYGHRNPHRGRISGGIANRVSKFENLGGEGSTSRPVTPPNQYASVYFPPTPAETPYTHRFKTENTPHNTPQQLLENDDTSMEETVKPIRRRSALCNVDVFQEMRREAEEGNGMPSPPNTAPLPTSSIFDSAPMPASHFLNMAHKNVDHLKSDPGYESSNYSPTSTTYSPRHISRHSSPRFPQASLFSDPFENKPTFDAANGNPYERRESLGLGLDQSISPSRGPSKHRSDSISSVNLEESITETGITIDDIATFIEGPGPDNKWLCLYPDCKKRFGRKENIKSHVQTHLGDRQYQCPHCQKCFVRQHDLKRHAKIHSGVKPYPCLCGNSFARHDALTRHRQRGMCIGAFEGVVKKVVKRGRPRKPRPDVDERQEKSSRTRSKNKTTSISSASSASGYSDSNSGSSPPATYDGFDRASFGGSQSRPENVHYSQAAMDCVSPQAIHSARPTSALSTHSYHSNHRNSIVSLSDHLPSHHGSRANTPPSLSQSSPSPTPGAHYFDLEAASEESEHGDMDANNKPLVRFEDDDIFLQDYSSNMNQDPDIMMMNKFADAFGASGNTNEMFGTLESDVFFGSP